MNDLKDFVIYALKSPLLWGVAIAWLNANLKWILPQAPAEVIKSAVDLLTIVGTLVVAYLGGKYVERTSNIRRMTAALPKRGQESK